MSNSVEAGATSIPVESRATSVTETAGVLNCSPSKVWSEISLGRLRAVKLGRRTIILPEDREKYLRELPSRVASESELSERQVQPVVLPEAREKYRRELRSRGGDSSGRPAA